MARPGAVAKMLFYPCPPEVVDLIATHLWVAPTDLDRVHILDPCAGEGAAIHGLSKALGIPESNVYAIELDVNRAAAVKALMPEAHVLPPSSYMGSQVSAHAFSMVYCNPPFDDELGGGKREEHSFLSRAAIHLNTGGVIVFVCPVGTWPGRYRFFDEFDRLFEDVRYWKFPDAHRKFKEVVLIGRKRKIPVPHAELDTHGTLSKENLKENYDFKKLDENVSVIGEPWIRWTTKPSEQRSYYRAFDRVYDLEPELAVYQLLRSTGPSSFRKIALTDDEKMIELRKSPLNELLKPTEEVTLERPPIPPAEGHTAQLLASGMLNGTVPEYDDDAVCVRVHVVRGTETKNFVPDGEPEEKYDEETETLIVKTVEIQRPDLVIRAVDQNGELYTFTTKPKETTLLDAPTSATVTVTVVEPEPDVESSPSNGNVIDVITPTSYKLAIWDTPDASGPGVCNGLRFPDAEMCSMYGEDLASRWTRVTKWKVMPSSDPVNRWSVRVGV